MVEEFLKQGKQENKVKIPETSETTTSNIERDPQQKSEHDIKKNFSWRLLFIVGGLVLLFIVTGIIYSYITETESIKSTPQDSAKTSNRQRDMASPVEKIFSSYESSYWGFSLKYPSDYKAWEGGYDLTLANFDLSNKKWDYIPKKNELKIEIRAYDKSPSGIEYPPRNSETFRNLSIGDYPVVLYKVKVFSGGKVVNTYLITRVRHKEIIYSFLAEPSDSSHIEIFLKILESFAFIPKDEYLTGKITPTANTKIYENLRYGFAVSYPVDWHFRDFEGGDDAHLTLPDKSSDIEIILMPRYLSRGNIIEDLKHEASLYCAADGPSGSIYCPEEQTSIEVYTNPHGTKGYAISRNIIEETCCPKKKKSLGQQMIYAYELPIQEYFAVLISSFRADTNDQIQLIADSFKKLQIKPR